MKLIPFVITRLSLLFLMVFVFGCASSPNADNFAKSTLADRSPTLPNGVSAWMPIFGFSPSKESSNLIVPLQWEQGYTDRLTLIWMPLPLQLRYLIVSDKEQWISTEIALFGSNYSRSRDYNWRPSISLGWKRRINSTFGFESKFQYQGEVKRGGSDTYSRTLSLQNGILINATSWLDINPSFYIWNEKGEVRTQYLGEIPTSLTGAEAQNTHWRFPLGLKLVARLSHQSELHSEVRYYRLGYSEYYTEVPVFLTFVYFW